MKKLKLFFACLLMAVLSIGQVWGTVYFEDTFSNVGSASSGSVLPRDGWTAGSGTAAPQGNSGVRLGASSNSASIIKSAITSIEGTKSLKVTIYVARYNTNANTLTVTATNGTISALAEGSVGTLSEGTLTISPSDNAGVTSTTAAATWTDAYKSEFTITGASSATTITFSANKRVVLGPVKIEDAASAPSSCTSEITIAKADDPANGTFALDNSGTVCIDEGNATVNVTASPAPHYHLASVTSTVGTVGTISNNTCAITNIGANTTVSATFAEDDKVKVTWNVNGDESLKTDVYVGDKPVFPSKPDACDATSTTFIGWATAPWTGKLANLSEKTVYMSASAMPAVDAAVTYYAVFAKSSGSASNLFNWAGGKSADLSALEDVTLSGGGDYAESHSPYYVKFNGDGKYVTIAVASQPGKVTFGVKKVGGKNTCAMKVQEADAADGEFTDVEELEIAGDANAILELETTQAFKSSTRAVKLYFAKGSGDNVGLGPISIEGAVSYEDYMTTCSTPTVAAPTISGDEEFISSTTVTLTQADADAIYYTTDNSTPTTSLTPYSAPFTLTNTATVKAIAVKGGVSSAVAEKTFTKATVLETMAEVQAAATTTTDQSINVAISNWVVTAVSGSQVWFADADNAKGILLYKSGHGFEVGKKINGTVIGTKVKLYNLFPELTSLVASDVTVTDAEAVSPRSVSIPTLISNHPAEQGTLVKLDNVTYTSSMLSDGVNSIAADNKLYSSLALVEGTTYNIIGVVTYYKNGDDAVVKIAPRSAADVEAQTPVVTPTAANLAALKAAARGTYILTLENAVVTYVNGNNAFIEDATGGALIYFASHGYSAGDCLNGEYQVVTTDYQGKFEITAMEPQAGAATTTAEIPLTTVSIATLNANFSSYESRRVKIVGANVTDAISGSDRNGAINDGAALAVYAAVASTITLNADDNVDIIGYPGFHNTDQQLNVWRQEDITVNVKEDPELAYDPTVVNVLLSDLASFTPAVLEYATGFDGVAAITYESSDPSIATVESDGTVTLVATEEGSTIITASFAGNATYKADNASYTINVSATPITPVYTMSFDMTRASYDDAADAEVVWNSNVVTMTADKNDGTKVTNYLAGYYSGTTLITETRFYAKNSISFVPQSGVTITKIEWMSTAKGYATKLAAETFVNATAVVDGTDDKLVIITPSAAGEISVTLTDAARATAVTVYYEAEAEKAKLAASIAIANINTAVGAEDILLSDVAATSNPNKKAISYAVTSGSEYVSITGEGPAAAFHALAEGTATVTATIPNDFGNYTGATTTFDIVVAAAPATLESIAISGTASVLEYTDGQNFNPAGLVVTGTYSDASTAPISEGITWSFDPSPLTQGTTSVSVTATVSEITSDAFVVNGLTVEAAAAPTVDNVVILATYGTKLYAMSTTLSSSAFTAIEVEEDGSNIVVPTADAKAAIQWTRTTSGEDITFQDANSKYMAGGTGNTNMSLADDACNWGWNASDSYYYIGSRSFFYNKSNIFKNYSTGNAGGTDYSGFAEVRVIDPANIVVSSKSDPELAYDPEELEIEAADIASWSAPVFGYAEGFDGLAAIEYGSNNESVATVTEGGVISLAGGYGTAVITATFGGNTNYLAGSATYTITVNAPAPTPSGTTYRKVTATGDITDGEYLIVYEEESVAFNGNLTTLDAAHNTVDVVISDEVIAGSTDIDAAVFTIDVANGTLRAHMGDYIGVTSYGNGLKQNANAETYPAHSFSIDGEGNAVISLNDSWTAAMILNYNKGASDKRFRYYKSASPQQSIQLYKKETSEPVLDWEDARTGLTAGNYYTICLPKKVTAFRGATVWNLKKRNTAGTEVYLEEAELPFVAGTPFIINAKSDKLEVVYEGAETETPVESGALRGTLSGMTSEQLAAAGSNIYILKDNAIRPISGNWLSAGRAYIDYNSLEAVSTDPVPAPGRRVLKMPMQPKVPTGFENIDASETPMKLMIDGQIYILRGEKMYDTTGRLVK